MTLFLLTFFFLYGALHYYIFTKWRAAFALGIWPSLVLILFLLFFTLTPIFIYQAEKYGAEIIARVFAFVAFIWMGFAFLFFAGSLLLDLYRLLIWAGGLIFRRDLFPFSPSPLWQCFLPLLFSAAAAFYGGFFEARHIRTERVVILSPKIPKEIGPVRIAQISDVHLGYLVREDRLTRILKEVKEINPDLFVSTGDLVDAQISRLDGLTDLLQEIRPRFGKFAITGNHEFYAGLGQSLEFTRRAGFTMMRGEGVTISGIFNLAGVDDPAVLNYGPPPGLPEKELLSALPREKFTILMKHRPVVAEGSLGLFDLQISGHTHQGQIFPFRLLTRIFFPFDGGSFPLSSRALLHVSRGSGTWGPPIRFLTPPEVTLYELRPK